MIVPDHYCAYIQAGLYIRLDKNSQVTVGPCTLTPVEYIITDDKTFTHTQLVDFRDRNKLTQAMEGGCVTCKQYHDMGMISRTRDSANERYLTDKLIYNLPGPKHITFHLDYICNLACTTCGDALSTKWRGLTKVIDLPVQSSADQIKFIINNINTSCLETVHIFGGEPFLTKTHEIILEQLLPVAKNVTLAYDTNGTIIPNQRTLELWEQYHLVRIKFSIDALDDAFYYLRWPANWSEVKDNIFKMAEIVPVNHMFGFRPAVGFLNFHLIKDLRNWQQKYLPTNRLGDLTEFEYNPVYGIFCTANMTQEMKDDVRTLLEPNDPLLMLLPAAMPESGGGTLDEVLKALEYNDKLKGTDFRKSLPHLVKYFN